MKSARVKNTDLPVVVGTYLLRVESSIFSIDLKWTETFNSVKKEAIELAAPTISRDQMSETQHSISMSALTEFVRHHSQRKTDEMVFKEKLHELLRGFKEHCSCSSQVEFISNRSIVVLHPKQYTPAEVNAALQDLHNAADSNTFVRALANLPPCEKWFSNARAFADCASREMDVSARFKDFCDGEVFTAAVAKANNEFKSENLEGDVQAMCDAMRPFVKVIRDVPHAEILGSQTVLDAVKASAQKHIDMIVVNNFGNINKMWLGVCEDTCKMILDPSTTIAGSGSHTIPAEAFDKFTTFIQDTAISIGKAHKAWSEFEREVSNIGLRFSQLTDCNVKFTNLHDISVFLVNARDVRAFLTDGLLKPSHSSRYNRSVGLMGDVMKSYRLLTSAAKDIKQRIEADPDEVGSYLENYVQFMDMISVSFTPWLEVLAKELVEPMEFSFFANNFTTKFLDS